MLSENRLHEPPGEGSCLRQCPTPPGDARALITHNIAVGTCLQRQREFYHKCHRCLYRGKPANYVAERQEVNGVIAAREEDGEERASRAGERASMPEVAVQL